MSEYNEYGEQKIEFLRTYYPYENGVPSRSTIYRVLSILDPKQMNDILLHWISLKGYHQQIAIDGKTLCGDRNERKTHLVSALATESGIIIGQTKVEEKTNEIVAIPDLLNALEIQDHIISIDAMGCQKEIACLIVKKKAHYVFALKRNHLNLFDDVDLYFSDLQNERTVFENIDKSRGRVEVRKCSVSTNITWLSQKNEWPKLKSIIMIESTTYIKQKEHCEKKYYISDLDVDPKTMLQYIRAHWAIESNHWVLDVIFKEDKRILINEIFIENESLIRRFALNLIRLYKKHINSKKTLKSIRKIAPMNDKIMNHILNMKNI